MKDQQTRTSKPENRFAIQISGRLCCRRIALHCTMKVRVCWQCCAAAVLGLLSAVQSLLLLVESFLRSNGQSDDHSSFLELEIRASLAGGDGKLDSLGGALLRKGKETLRPWRLPLSLPLSLAYARLWPFSTRINTLAAAPWNISLCYATVQIPPRWSVPSRVYSILGRFQSSERHEQYKKTAALTFRNRGWIR